MELHRMFTKEELDKAGAANLQEIFRVQGEVRKFLRAELMKSVAVQTDALPGAASDKKDGFPSPL